MEKSNSNKKKLKILVIGCGYFGQKRIQACTDLKTKIHITGVVDQDVSKAKKIGEQYGVVYAASLNEFEKASVDAVIIATPNNTHASLVMDSLSRGWHVLCEKPLASSFQEAKKMVEAAQKYNKFIKTGSNHRFFPSVQKAYDLYINDEIGKILSFKGSIGNNGSHVSQSWFWNKDISGGGTFIDNGCHLLDIAQMFMGNFVSCVGSVSNVFWKKTRVEDIGTGIFLTKDNRQAVISSSWIQWHGYLYFELWGTKGFIIVDGRENNIVTVGKNNSQIVTTYDFNNLPRNSYHKELEYFTECIFSSEPPKPNAADGASVVQMIEGVYISTKKKSWVSL